MFTRKNLPIFTLITLLTLALLVVGALKLNLPGVVSAQDGSGCGDDGEEGGDHDDGQENEDDDTENEDCTDNEAVSYTGSVSFDESTIQNMNEAEQRAALSAAATVSLEDALTTALAQTDSKAFAVTLSSEGGFLVYTVELADGSDITIDAGDGSVLLVETPDVVDQ